jgi:hypothetical protein
MSTKFLAAALAATAALAIGAPALAHHSFAAQYDGNKPVRLVGKLVKIEWTNPHSYIHLAVVSKKDGAVQEWACEGANPGALSRRGFQRGDIKIGDTLTIDGFLAKNGSHLIDARRIFLASGKVIYGGSAGDGGPGDTGAE